MNPPLLPPQLLRLPPQLLRLPPLLPPQLRSFEFLPLVRTA